MKKNTKNNKTLQLIIGAGLAVVIIIIAIFTTIHKENKNEASNVTSSNSSNASNSNSSNASNGSSSNTSGSQTTSNGDLVIPISSVTDKASFYKYTTSDGTKLEVIAIKASDGTIRTSFNTCQVCYSSGKGYYVQQGDYLICQNCGNKFKADQVGVTKGGCNPVPILASDKNVDSTNITISKAFLEKSKTIFANWKL